MKRLTCRTEEGYCYIPIETNCVNGSYDIEDEELVEAQLTRLCEIEDILGNNYNLDHLKDLIKADKENKCVIFNTEYPITKLYSPKDEDDLYTLEVCGVVKREKERKDS